MKKTIEKNLNKIIAIFVAFLVIFSHFFQISPVYGESIPNVITNSYSNTNILKNINIFKNNSVFYNFDDNGNPSGGYYIDETSGSPTIYSIKYDANGAYVVEVQISEYIYTSDAVKFKSTVCTYNSDGKILTEKRYLPKMDEIGNDFSKDSLYMSFENINSYAGSTGKLTAHKECSYNPDGTPIGGSEFRNVYDGFGNLISKKSYKIEGFVRYITTSVENLYDETGKILTETNLYYNMYAQVIWDNPQTYVRETIYDENGKKSGTKTYHFNADGTKYEYVVTTNTTDTTVETGSTSPQIRYEYFYEYDEAGNTTAIKVFADSKPYTENYYAYNKNGNKLSEEYYAYHGGVRYLSYSHVFEYDGEYNLVKNEYSDYYYEDDVMFLNYRTTHEYDVKKRPTAKKYHTYFNDGTINWAKSYEYFYSYDDKNISRQEYYVYDGEKDVIWDKSYDITYGFSDVGELTHVVKKIDNEVTDYEYEDIPDLSEEDIVVHYGDCDCNGEIELLDLVLICKHIVGAEPLLGQGLLNSDCDGDGNVALDPSDADDAMALAQYLVKIVGSLPIAQD